MLYIYTHIQTREKRRSLKKEQIVAKTIILRKDVLKVKKKKAN